MRGVRALGSTGLDQAAHFAGREQRIKEPVLAPSAEQALAKIVQERMVEARIGQFEAEGMSGSQGAFRLPSPLRTGRAPLNASGSSKPYAARISAPLTVERWPEWSCSWQTW